MLNIRAFINSPIRKNFLANLFGIGVQLLNQIVLVPFYILYWGNNLYSDWIVLSALTVIFGMSDIGINSVIQNRFSIKYAEGNHSECSTLLSFNFIIITIVASLSIGGTIVYVATSDISQNLDLHLLSRDDASLIFILLLVNIFLNMYSGIPNAIFRGKHLNSKAVLIDQFAKLLTVAITFTCLLMSISITTMCILLVAPPLMALAYKCYATQRLFKWVPSLRIRDWGLMRTIFIQALGYLSFPVCNAIILQGFTLVVNKFFGADTVVLYNTTRTMCNFIKTLLATVLHSAWPEFSIAYGERNTVRMSSLYYKSIKVSVLGAIVISLGILIFGPWIYSIWTHSQIPFDYSLTMAFLVVLVINTFWNTGCVVLIATNNHIELGLLDLFATILSIIAAVIVAQYTHSISAMVYCTLIIDVILTIFVHKKFKTIILKVAES